MARTVPGSGAVIEPIFDEIFGVRAIKVLEGGSGYSQSDPPRLTVTGCGTPDQAALLYPTIDSESGRITHVRVLERGKGYDPLRLRFFPEQETPNVVTSFDVNKIWQSHPNSPTTGTFTTDTDRLRIISDNHPKPTWSQAESIPSGGPLIDRSFDQTFVYRGGKDAPDIGTRIEQNNKVLGILANGGLLHTPEWGSSVGNAPTNFAIDSVKYDYVKSNTVYDTVTEGNVRYYQSSKVIDEFKTTNGVFEWGKLKQYAWNIKVEYGNILLNVTNVDETLGNISIGRIVDEIGGGARGEIAKVIRDGSNNVTRIYLRTVSDAASFLENDRCLGSNGFTFTISAPPISLNLYYIDFGTDAEKFGPFTSGQYYLAPDNITVKRNSLIKFNQSDSSNSQGAGHPIQFSTTADGVHNDTPGTLYYQSTGASSAPAADYENEYAPLLIMNSDETNRIYYFCKNHPNMSGYDGNEGYITISSDTTAETITNNYYVENHYGSGNSIDYSRHPDGHSKILGMSYDGYPIYGPYGYDLGGTSVLTETTNGDYYSGLFFDVDTGYPTTPFTGSGSGATVDILTIGTYQEGAIGTIRISEGGSGYAVGDKVKIIHKYPGAIMSYSNVGSTTGADASRTPGTYTVAIQDSWTSGNGKGGTVTVVVGSDGSITSNNFIDANGTTVKYSGPNGARGYDYAEDEIITIPDSALGGGGGGPFQFKALFVIDDGWRGMFVVTAIGNGMAKQASSFRLRTTAELPGPREVVNTASTVTHTVTVSNGEFLFGGSRPNFLSLSRGKTYIFNQNDSSNDTQFLLLSETENGWHSTGNSADIGDTSYLYSLGVEYYLDGSQVTNFSSYLSGFNTASTREVKFTVPATAPTTLYVFAYPSTTLGVRTVQTGYILGDLVQDYIYDSSVGTLDAFNGKFAVTPEYPNGTYAYFMTEDSSGNPVYPYVIGPKYYGSPLFEGDTPPAISESFPNGATGDVVLDANGAVSYIKMSRNGDNYFGPAKAKILGGEGAGATGTPTVQTITGLTLLNPGRSYQTAPTVIFEGGGGQDAKGAAKIDTTGKVTSVSIADPGEFYQEPPYVLLSGGGGIGAKAVATIFQGAITGITVTDPGEGYTSSPNVIFTRLVNLKRKTRARQSNNTSNIYLTGLTKDVAPDDSEIFVRSTSSFPGSGRFILGYETVSYTSKTTEKFGGLTRGVNFNYDQRVILDAGQNDQFGISTYKFNVGDRLIRRVENANNKIAKVYDWNPATRELLVTFEIDELAFIDGGIPSTEDATVQFDAGVANSTGFGQQPHVLLLETGSSIITLTDPISSLVDKKFEDDDENDGTGDGIPDLVNTGTDYLNQINLDGGIFNSLYGIEATQGGTNTTLFQVGDAVKDANVPFRYADISTAGGLNEGTDHTALVNITLDADFGNGQNYSVNEVVTGEVSGVKATVVSWDPNTSILQVKSVIPFNTGNVAVGEAGYLYQFSENSTIVDIYIQNPGTNYTAVPTVAIENTGDIQAVGTVVMTTAADQVSSITLTNGGYGITQTIDGTYNLHTTITFTNAGGDTTGSGAAGYAIMGGEKILGNGGASYRIKSIEYLSSARS